MKRLVFFVVAQMVLLGAAWAQNGVAVRIAADPCGQFRVDGQLYTDRPRLSCGRCLLSTRLDPVPSYAISNDIRCSGGSHIEAGPNLCRPYE